MLALSQSDTSFNFLPALLYNLEEIRTATCTHMFLP